MSSETLDHLRQYVQNPRFVGLAQLEASGQASIPEHWRTLLALDGSQRVACVLDQWRQSADRMVETRARLDARLETVELLADDEGLRLLYGIRGNGRMLYYASDSPLARRPGTKVARLWPSLPESVRRFYDFADGWCYLASRSMGPSPCSEMFVLGEEDWGILDDMDEPPKLDLQRVLALFTNGAFAYACADTADPDPKTSGLVWWSDKPPRLRQDFWGVVDTWTALGLDA